MAEYRYWRNENRHMLKDVIPLDTPYNLCVETSTFCNLDCKYCGHSRHIWPEENMSMELFKRVVDDTKAFPHKLKKMELYFFGEPLCNPILPEMLAYARNADISETIDFTTNGLLFSKEKVDELRQAGMPDTIRISLQGLDAKSYNDVCGRNIDFDSFVSNLTYLYQNKGECTIRMKIADISIKNEPNGKERFESIFGGISDSLFVETIIPIYSDVNYYSVDGDIIKHAKEGRKGIKNHKINKVCHRPFYRLAVRTNGDVTAACCDQLNDVVYENIYRQSLSDIWGGSVREEFLKLQLEGKRFTHPCCMGCIMPNDITNEADILDPWAEEILERIKKRE